MLEILGFVSRNSVPMNHRHVRLYDLLMDGSCESESQELSFDI